MIVYYNGNFLEKDKVCISPDDRGFLFADGTYEVIRVYHGKPFRLTDHLKRLKRSLHEICIDCVDVSDLQQVGENLIRKNPNIADDAALYIQITRGVASRYHQFPENSQPTIYASLLKSTIDPKVRTKGVKIILRPDQRWGRCDIKSIALLANILAAEEARKQNAYEAVFIKDGVITEGTRTNISAVFNGKVHTHPTGYQILGGITRDVVLELCKKLKIGVIEKPFSKKQLLQADEIFLMGTTTEIGPVIQVDDVKIRNGTPGAITKILQEVFRSLIS